MGKVLRHWKLPIGAPFGWGVVLVAIVLIGLGCTGHQEKGDRAMELGDYSMAMSYYEAAIEEGTRDPDLYYRAARSAQRLGAFAKAERYFSQALRYGGGPDVARALAEFYIQTSNFGQAAKVFQYLAHFEQEEPQPLYSNLGTALMYAGSYLDAETYLLLAQQLEPTDAVPYINLGVLYDRHLRNLPRAIRFYECYTQLSSDESQIQTVNLRLRELRGNQYIDTSRVQLECGEEFRVVETEHHDLRTIFDLDADSTQSTDDNGHPHFEIGEELNLDLPLEYDPAETPPASSAAESQEQPEIIIESLGSGTDSDTDREPGAEREEFRSATRDFEAGRYDAAVQVLEQIPPESRNDQEKALLGRSYYGMGRTQKAADLLEEVLMQRPTPVVAQTLIAAFEREGDEEGKKRVCERFSGWPDYEEALSDCE